MISAVEICKWEINKRTVLAVAAIGFTSIGYLLGPAAALPIDCWDQLYQCDGQLTLAGYPRSTIQSVCGRRMQACFATNQRNGYTGVDPLGPPLPGKEADDEKKKKPKDDWKRHVYPHVGSPTKNGSIGSNAQLGKASTPTTAASTATSGVTNPTAALPPKPPTVSTQAIARERAGRF